MVAIAFMILAGVTNAAMLSLVKFVSEDIHPFEIALFRAVFGFIVLLPLIARAGAANVFETRRFGLQIVRAALNTGAVLAFFLSLSFIPLATAVSIAFAAPIFTTVMAIFLLGERVGIRRWAGLLLGFLGMIIIVRPGPFSLLEFGAFLALFASVCWAGTMIAIKQLTRTESNLSIIAWSALLVALMTLLPALSVWRWPTAEQWIFLGLIGCLGSLIQLGFTKAFSLADTVRVLPFDYLQLVWASLFGFVIFSEVPDPWVWVGGTLIFSSVLYIAHRERMRHDGSHGTSRQHH